MSNAGAAAVLHVYDRFDLAAIPRRYTVGSDAIVDGTWTTYDGRYDLWLLGPNGFHRHYAATSMQRRCWPRSRRIRTIALACCYRYVIAATLPCRLSCSQVHIPPHSRASA